MFDTINGVPAHPLLVHAAVVLVPAAALAVVLSALVPRFRRWSGLLTPLLATVAAGVLPLVTQSGESLEERVTETALMERHADMGESLLPWAAALAALAWVSWWLGRRTGVAGRSGGVGLLVVGLLGVVAAVGSTVQVYRIGHSGAEAVWSDTGAATGGGDD
ncbi:MAG: DUF2231 domain-containing protein [Nocardioides sp.]